MEERCRELVGSGRRMRTDPLENLHQQLKTQFLRESVKNEDMVMYLKLQGARADEGEQRSVVCNILLVQPRLELSNLWRIRKQW